jgi:hypothetical protein
MVTVAEACLEWTRFLTQNGQLVFAAAIMTRMSGFPSFGPGEVELLVSTVRNALEHLRDANASVNFLTGFKWSKGATPAKLFQVSTRRDIGQPAVSLASSCEVENDCRFSAAAGNPATAVMLLSESIVNVDIFLLFRS